MQPSHAPKLIRLSNTDLVLAHPDQDIRGHKVVDSDEDEIGHVEDLLIDDTQKRVRFLLIVAGGFLGIGQRKFLIPVDAVKQINKVVHVARTRDHVAASPVYDPDLVTDNYYDQLYNHYGILPFWTAGYLYPVFPFYP